MKYNNIPDASSISKEELNMLTSNIDAVYVFLDLYIDTMKAEEILNWKKILDLIEEMKQNENI